MLMMNGGSQCLIIGIGNACLGLVDVVGRWTLDDKFHQRFIEVVSLSNLGIRHFGGACRQRV